MQFEINLASQPYQDLRRFLTRWGLVVAAALLVSGVLLYHATADLLTWRHMRGQIRSLEQQIALQDRKKVEVQTILDRPENRSMEERSRFLNTLIARKAFSWTEVFMDMEKIVPAHLRIKAITPAINAEDQLEVTLTAVAPQRDTAIELVRRLEHSPHFSHAAIIGENVGEARGGPGQTAQPEIEFHIVAQYTPNYQRPANGHGEEAD